MNSPPSLDRWEFLLSQLIDNRTFRPHHAGDVHRGFDACALVLSEGHLGENDDEVCRESVPDYGSCCGGVGGNADRRGLVSVRHRGHHPAGQGGSLSLHQSLPLGLCRLSAIDGLYALFPCT